MASKCGNDNAENALLKEEQANDHVESLKEEENGGGGVDAKEEVKCDVKVDSFGVKREVNCDVEMEEVTQKRGNSDDPPNGSGACENSEGQNDSNVKDSDGPESGGGESREVLGENDDSRDDNDDFPGIKSELVVLDEVGGDSLDGKEDTDDSPTDSKEDGPDANTSSAAAGDESNDKGGQRKSVDDPYAYVRRQDFTSEKYKIEIRNLPKYFGFGELKKLLNDKLKLASHKMKPTKNRSQGVFVCFKNEADKAAAIRKLHRLPWKGKQLYAVNAKPAPDPLVKKRKLDNEAALNEHGKKIRLSDEEKLRNSTTPYWNIPYDEQLQKKYDYVSKVMCKLADQIFAINHMLGPWIKRQKSKYKGMACKLLDIRKSPVHDGYRNKCEFTIGFSDETKERMVGFRLGSYVQGQVGVGPIDSLKHIPQRMKDTVKVFEKFIRESPREPFNSETHSGHWRQLTLRLSTLDQLMAIVIVDSRGATPEDIVASREEVKNFFENGEGKDLKVDSLYFQACGKRESGKEPPKVEHLLGEKYITESLMGLKFRISPEAFFQVNTPGAGVLYSTVGEVIELSPSTTVVDICCGTGTIGLSLAKDCGQVLGLEIVSPAVEDAKVNAVENNISNVEFFTGRAEEILTSVLTRAKGESVYAIVDPPRSGLQQKAMVSLRGAEIIEKVVYVSCDPLAAMKNFVDLARVTSKVYHSYPLVPVIAIPVDMFPHTSHCEVVILFQRVNPLNLPKTYPGNEDDIAILSRTLKESPTMPPDSGNKDGDNNGNDAASNNPDEAGKGETTNGSKTTDDAVDQVQKESPALGDPKTAEKAKQKRKRPGRNQRLYARMFGNYRETGVPSLTEGLHGPSSSTKPSLLKKHVPDNKASACGTMGKFGPQGRLGGNSNSKGPTKLKPAGKSPFIQSLKMNSLTEIREKSFNPNQGGPAKKRKWKKNYPPLRGGVVIYDEDEIMISEGPRGSFQPGGPRENHPRRAPWKEGQPREMRSRSPPNYSSRDCRGRGVAGSHDTGWQKLELGGQNWIKERERCSGSPALKLMRRDASPQGREGRVAGHYSPSRLNYREDWPMRGDDRAEHGRFERQRPVPDWELQGRRGTASPHARFEGEEHLERIDDERWGPGGCAEEFSFRRSKLSGGVAPGRSDISDRGERHSRTSCEEFSLKSPEILSRSGDRVDRHYGEGFELRSSERYDRRSSERYDERSSERYERRPCERCDRSSERVYRLEIGGLEGDSRPKPLSMEREIIPPKFAPRMERYTESEMELRRNAENFIDREYIARPSSPRKVAGVLGSMELHRKNEVIMYRGPNDDGMPHPLELEGRIAVAQAVPEDRASQIEKRFEANLLQRNYDSEFPSGSNDHSLIARRVEVIRRPFIVDNKYGMLLDTSGKTLGTAEVLLVTTKNHLCDIDDRRECNRGPSTSRILEQREIGMVHSGSNLSESLGGRSQEVWIMEREIMAPWSEVERSKVILDESGMSDANMKNPVSPQNAKMVSYPVLHSFRQKLHDPQPNSQYPPRTPSHFLEEIPERSHSNQNVPFSFASSSSSGMAASFQSPNSSSSRPTVPTQNPPSILGLSLTAQIPSLIPNQLRPMQSAVGGSIGQRIPPSLSSSDSRMDSWNFRQATPWTESSQQMMSQKNRW
ncbi:uncharacterized protein LOC124158743 [Ischnura elegans]|uniref:uncharacterized protein LOC124158743 n=1 Tax=Ischnura elegans TaxID=197161 RepID=UPI001ED8BF61|nr:uncharacterized protein LOC124158743 [Ischnura elegans]